MDKIRNKTQVDAAGARLGLYREPDETLDAFQLRVRSAVQYGLHRSKESFEDSLDYITANRTKNILYVEPVNFNKETSSISFDGVFINIDGTDYNLDDCKFVVDLKERLTFHNYQVVELDGYSDFLKTKNVLQFTSERHEINYTTPRSQLFKIDKIGVENVVDSLGAYNKEESALAIDLRYSWDRSDEKETFFIKENAEDTLVFRENHSEDTISFDYKKFPLVIKWSVFNYYNLNDINFDYRIKSLKKVNYNDESETPYLLTQEGAKLINKCYKLSNTYWGK